MSKQTVIVKRQNGRKTTHETVAIPDDATLVAAAIELRELGGKESIAARRYGNCIGLYIPAREYSLTDVDLFTGEHGETRKGGTIPPVCAFWLGADVRIAEARYECNPIDIYYYCKRADGIQCELFHDEPQEISEGAVRIVEQTEYERNPHLRELALRHHGRTCVVCGFDFAEVYGERAEGFIHVHHLTPLSSVGTAHAVNVETDLVPVCPNCHAVIHLSDPPFTPDEVREMISKHR